MAGIALCACTPAGKTALSAEQRQFAASGFSDAVLLKTTASFSPGVRMLARRHDPGLNRPDTWGRPEGWASLDLHNVPDLGLSVNEGEAAAPEIAQEVNALRPFSGLPIRPMRPFVLTADTNDRTRAVHCMAQAVYY
ncbi:MAG: hypothetical protein ACREEG_10230, partial [Phenylobacterium sp.]